MFYVANLGHIFVKSSTAICYNINKLTYLLTYNYELRFVSSCDLCQHVLCQILPPPKHTDYNLPFPWSRTHHTSVPKLQFEYLHKSFIFRMLYYTVY